MSVKSVQDIHGSDGRCFGCGPKNEKGLRIKSYWEGEDFILRFNPKPEHQAFPGSLNGGIIGTLFDCHANWCAATTLYKLNPEKEFPSTVTSKFEVELKRPTPFGVEILVKAKPKEIDGNKVTIKAELIANGKVTAIFEGIFVAVDPGHPAYHRWT